MSTWQKLRPQSDDDGNVTVPLAGDVSATTPTLPTCSNNRASFYVSQGSHQDGITSRSMPWPRNCARLIVYATGFMAVLGMCGFFVAQRPSPFLQNSIPERLVEVADEAGTMKFETRSKAKFAEPKLTELIDKERIPNVVHYVWCETGHFEFKHYVSVQSAIKFLRPDLVMVHLTSEPEPDPLGYNDWWDRLKRDTQNLIVHHIDKPASFNCSGDAAAARQIFEEHVRPQGGVYLASSGVILSSPVDLKLKEKPMLAFDFPNSQTSKSILADLPALILFKKSSTEKFETVSQCLASTDFESSTSSPSSAAPCLTIQDSDAVPFYPKDVWESPSNFGKLVRALAYDTENILTPQPQPDSPIPLICHYLWLGGGTMDFLLYLSILSCLNILKADAVLVHGELEPQGPLWNELLALGDQRLSYVYRPQQVTMYGAPVKKLAAMSDVLRTDILLKYGGIYTDWDAIWVKPLDAEIRSYEAVVAPDWPAKLRPFPTTLNLGVMLAKPGSSYVRHLQEGMADYADGVGPLEWCFICLRAYKVLEKYPHTARLEPRLQVMGYLGRYHPIWQQGAGDDMFDGKFDWRTETYAVHWTFPTPKELRSKAGLKRANSTAADIARYVLKTSAINL